MNGPGPDKEKSRVVDTFILLTRLVHEEVYPSFSFISDEKKVVQKISEHLPDVQWIGNYAVVGPWDYLDIFEARDLASATKVSALVRHYGGAHTEIWPAHEWNAFEKIIQDLQAAVRE